MSFILKSLFYPFINQKQTENTLSLTTNVGLEPNNVQVDPPLHENNETSIFIKINQKIYFSNEFLKIAQKIHLRGKEYGYLETIEKNKLKKNKKLNIHPTDTTPKYEKYISRFHPKYSQHIHFILNKLYSIGKKESTIFFIDMHENENEDSSSDDNHDVIFLPGIDTSVPIRTSRIIPKKEKKGIKNLDTIKHLDTKENKKNSDNDESEDSDSSEERSESSSCSSGSSSPRSSFENSFGYHERVSSKTLIKNYRVSTEELEKKNHPLNLGRSWETENNFYICYSNPVKLNPMNDSTSKYYSFVKKYWATVFLPILEKEATNDREEQIKNDTRETLFVGKKCIGSFPCCHSYYNSKTDSYSMLNYNQICDLFVEHKYTTDENKYTFKSNVALSDICGFIHHNNKNNKPHKNISEKVLTPSEKKHIEERKKSILSKQIDQEKVKIWITEQSKNEKIIETKVEQYSASSRIERLKNRHLNRGNISPIRDVNNKSSPDSSSPPPASEPVELTEEEFRKRYFSPKDYAETRKARLMEEYKEEFKRIPNELKNIPSDSQIKDSISNYTKDYYPATTSTFNPLEKPLEIKHIPFEQRLYCSGSSDFSSEDIIL